MEKSCIRLQFHFTSERPVRCVAMLPIISWPFPVSQTSRSWKARRLSATSSRDSCRVAQHFSTGSSVTRRNPDNRQICIPSNRHWARQPAENFRVVTAGRAKRNERGIRNSALPPGAPWSFHKMIGEGTQSTNQRQHSYVQDHVEVGFFTDPTVCIGCKACEVACKEWNEVPDDGFGWLGNS